MKQTIRLTEGELRGIISKSIKNILNEFIAGGNDWQNTYSDYKLRNRTNEELDDIVKELHTICQYYEELYDANDNNQILNMFPKCNQFHMKNALNAMGDIYALMMNRNNIKGDTHSMTFEDIMKCKNNLEKLSQIECLGPISRAARRALSKL